MARELSNAALSDQLQAFIAYSARGGSLSFEQWMESKDFTLEDRATLRAVWTRATREAS